jgi:hypothetical protein
VWVWINVFARLRGNGYFCKPSRETIKMLNSTEFKSALAFHKALDSPTQLRVLSVMTDLAERTQDAKSIAMPNRERSNTARIDIYVKCCMTWRRES